MAGRWGRLCFSLMCLAALLGIGCGGGSDSGTGSGAGSSGYLTSSDIRSVLAKLPYQYDFKSIPFSGPGAVVAGTVRKGPHHSEFAVISGHPSYRGRVIPRQRLPNGGFQKGVDSRYGRGYEVLFVYGPASTPPLTEDIDYAMCLAAGNSKEACAV
jgi:hypothetical protein